MARAVDVAAQSVFLIGPVVSLAIGAGDADVDLVIAEWQKVAVLAGQHSALLAGEDRLEGHIHRRRDVEEVRNLDDRAQCVRAADGRREETALALDGRVRVLEVRRVEDGNACELQPRAAIANGPVLLVVDDLGRLDLPERRLGGILAAGFARAEDAPAQDGRVAAGAQGTGGGQPASVGEQNLDTFDEALAKIAGQLDELGKHHMAARVEEADVAGGGDEVGPQIVGNGIGH